MERVAKGRCPRHLREQRAIYSGPWQTLARQAIAAHVATFGQRCLGDAHHGPHPSADLAADHVMPGTLSGGVAVMCRAANTAKANRGRAT